MERHLRVPRTARYHTLGDPASATERWYVIHGYRQLAQRFVQRFRGLPGLAEGRRAVVAPEGLSRFYVEEEVGPHGPASRVGASWMTREDRDHEIEDYVGYLDRLAEREAGPQRTVVLGFSQGSETASRWATLGRVRPDELILWGGGLAADLPTDALAAALDGVRVRLVIGRDDGWGRKKAAETELRLAEVGLRAERIDYDGGHRVPAEVLARHWPS